MINPNQVLIGSILGDGSLSSLSKREELSTIDISQNVDKLSYLKWLHKILSEILVLNPIRKKKGFPQIYRFKSKPSKIVGNLRKKFYSSQTGKKIVPSDIRKLLKDSIALAVWYMDDGTLDKRNKYHFNSSFATNCFTFEECKLLKTMLKRNFGLNVSVNKTTMRGKIYPRIYVKSESTKNFLDIIGPHIQPIFSYKVGK